MSPGEMPSESAPTRTPMANGEAEIPALQPGSIETEIAGAWETILGVAPVAGDDNFFDLGGNSLSVVRFSSWVFETYGVDIPLTDFFEHPTAARLALVVAALASARGGQPAQGRST